VHCEHRVFNPQTRGETYQPSTYLGVQPKMSSFYQRVSATLGILVGFLQARGGQRNETVTPSICTHDLHGVFCRSSARGKRNQEGFAVLVSTQAFPLWVTVAYRWATIRFVAVPIVPVLVLEHSQHARNISCILHALTTHATISSPGISG
jgi:hypothetical protein